MFSRNPFARFWQHLFAGVATVFLLASCASLEAETPQQRVFALKSEYQALLVVAERYERLPRCEQTNAEPCSKIDIVDIIRKADKNADLALDTAEEIVRLENQPGDNALRFAMDAARKAVEAFAEALVLNGVK